MHFQISSSSQYLALSWHSLRLAFGHGPPWHAPGLRWPHICPTVQCEFPFESFQKIPANVSQSRVRTTLIPLQHLARLWKNGRIIMSRTLLHKVCNHPVFIKTTCTHGVKNLKPRKGESLAFLFNLSKYNLWKRNTKKLFFDFLTFKKKDFFFSELHDINSNASNKVRIAWYKLEFVSQFWLFFLAIASLYFAIWNFQSELHDINSQFTIIKSELCDINLQLRVVFLAIASSYLVNVIFFSHSSDFLLRIVRYKLPIEC